MTQTSSTPLRGADEASSVLGFARRRRAEAQAAEADVLQAAARWAELHPAESIIDAATVPGSQGCVAVAGPGAPLVAEFCVPEFALAIGVSTDAGRELIGDAVELRSRLPRTWARVVAGDLPAWRARRIAQETPGLTREAALFVDDQVAPFAPRVGLAQTQRLVEEAIARFMPAEAKARAEAAAERRHFTVRHQQVGFDGTTAVEGVLDLADALDLDAAVAGEAEALRLAGCDASLDVRRALAVGVLARRQLALDLETSCCSADDRGEEHAAPVSEAGSLRSPLCGRLEGPAPAPAPVPAPTARRDVTLYVHLTADTLDAHPGTDGFGLARVENHRQVVTVDRVRAWINDAANAGTDVRVTVKPVIDLNHAQRVDAYEVPDRMAEHVALRDGHCVFPWCTRTARSCDTDHVQPWPRGSTDTRNLAPLCRRHHRLKTHSPWTYTPLDDGEWVWASPHGYSYLVDSTGTRDIST